jgi:hypothetical protein
LSPNSDNKVLKVVAVLDGGRTLFLILNKIIVLQDVVRLPSFKVLALSHSS